MLIRIYTKPFHFAFSYTKLSCIGIRLGASEVGSKCTSRLSAKTHASEKRNGRVYMVVIVAVIGNVDNVEKLKNVDSASLFRTFFINI